MTDWPFDEYEAQITSLRAINAELLACLKFFMADERFRVAVGGNPIAVDKMIAQVRSTMAKAEEC